MHSCLSQGDEGDRHWTNVGFGREQQVGPAAVRLLEAHGHDVSNARWASNVELRDGKFRFELDSVAQTEAAVVLTEVKALLSRKAVDQVTCYMPLLRCAASFAV